MSQEIFCIGRWWTCTALITVHCERERECIKRLCDFIANSALCLCMCGVCALVAASRQLHICFLWNVRFYWINRSREYCCPAIIVYNSKARDSKKISDSKAFCCSSSGGDASNAVACVHTESIRYQSIQFFIFRLILLRFCADRFTYFSRSTGAHCKIFTTQSFVFEHKKRKVSFAREIDKKW